MSDFITCIKCRKEIPIHSVYCLYCGKKQERTKKQRPRKRPHGTGTISRDSRCKNKWIAHAPSENGKRLYLGSYPTAKEAQEAINRYLLNQDYDKKISNMTLLEVYQIWSEIHYQQVSQSAIRLYSSTWKHFSSIQDMPIRMIRTADFQKMINHARSASTAHAIKILAGMLCKYAIENDLIEKSYAQFIKIPMFEKSEKKIFTPKEISVLWKHSDDKRVQIILFLIYTGLRIGELSALKVSDLDLEQGYMICGEKTKAGKNRIVPFPGNIPEIAEFVRIWASESQSDSRESLLGMTTAQLRHQCFYAALTELGLITPSGKQNGRFLFDTPHYTPHSTRHTFASLSASAGIQPENLQKIIGHANYSTTAEIYIHKNIDELKCEMQKIQK